MGRVSAAPALVGAAPARPGGFRAGILGALLPAFLALSFLGPAQASPSVRGSSRGTGKAATASTGGSDESSWKSDGKFDFFDFRIGGEWKSGALLVDLDMLVAEGRWRRGSGLVLGLQARLISMRNRNFYRVDGWETWRHLWDSWGRFVGVLGHGAFRTRLGLLAIKRPSWIVPQVAADRLWRGASRAGPARGTLEVSGGTIGFLPIAGLGVALGPVLVMVEGELLGWSPLGAEGKISGAVGWRGLSASLTWSIFRDGGHLTQFGGSDSDNLERADTAVWSEAGWLLRLQAGYDVWSLFRHKTPNFAGRLTVGFRLQHRRVIEHRLTDRAGRPVFGEDPGGYWSLWVGVLFGVGVME